VSFGGLHTDHRAIVAVAIIVFFVLTLVVTVLPALREQAFPSPPGAKLRGHEEERGRQVYMREGCGFCHTQFVRDLPMDRPYGRPSEPGDYVHENPPMLGTQRTGPDLADVGSRQPSEAWHLIHLYDPRAVVPQSVMPAYRWFFLEKDRAGSDDVVVPIPSGSAPRGKVVVAGPDATELVRYLMSLKQPRASR
jgi:cytochrome c oxidase cbb3-type subunit II